MRANRWGSVGATADDEWRYAPLVMHMENDPEQSKALHSGSEGAFLAAARTAMLELDFVGARDDALLTPARTLALAYAAYRVPPTALLANLRRPALFAGMQAKLLALLHDVQHAAPETPPTGERPHIIIPADVVAAARRRATFWRVVKYTVGGVVVVALVRAAR